MTYDPQHDKKNEVKLRFKLALNKAFNNEDKKTVMEASNLASDEAKEVRVIFYLPIPDSTPKPQKNLNLWGLVNHTKKPDIDNLEKFILDCANDILFPDDSMIVSLKSTKHYSNNPRTEIEVMSLKQKHYGHNVELVLKTFSPDELKEFLDYVQNFTRFFPEEVDGYLAEDDGAVKRDWLSSLCATMIIFSCKYSDQLKKIEKGKKIISLPNPKLEGKSTC